MEVNFVQVEDIVERIEKGHNRENCSSQVWMRQESWREERQSYDQWKSGPGEGGE